MEGRIRDFAKGFQMEEDGFIDVSVVRLAGIYLLLYKGVVVYVGQSRQVYTRVYQHLMARGKLRKTVYTKNPKPKLKVGFAFDQVLVRACTISELDDMEKELIRKYRPKHNIQHNAPPPIPLDQLMISLTLATRPPSDPTFNRRV